MALMNEARDRMRSDGAWSAAVAVGRKHGFPDELILHALVGKQKAMELMAAFGVEP